MGINGPVLLGAWRTVLAKKNVAALCLCPKSLSEAKLKNFGLMALVEEISRQSTDTFWMDLRWNSCLAPLLVIRTCDQRDHRL